MCKKTMTYNFSLVDPKTEWTSGMRTMKVASLLHATSKYTSSSTTDVTDSAAGAGIGIDEGEGVFY